ncbi:MAG: hypothetical protein K6T91_07300 [Firmicutes bacterium]|nr:hypothetical protein [Bacillota bacterium]
MKNVEVRRCVVVAGGVARRYQMSKLDVDELALRKAEKLIAVLIKLQSCAPEIIRSASINSSIVTPPRQKGYVAGGVQIYIPAKVRERYTKVCEGLDELIKDVEATIKRIREKEKRAWKRLSEKF